MKSVLWSVVLLSLISLQTAFCADVVIEHITVQTIKNAQNTVKNLIFKKKLWQLGTVAGAAALGGFAVYKMFLAPPKVIGSTITLDPEKLSQALDRAGRAANLLSKQTVRFQYFNKCLEKGEVIILQQEESAWYAAPFNWLKQQVYANAYQIAVGAAGMAVFNFMNNSLGPISKYIQKLDGFVDRTASWLTQKNNLEWLLKDQGNLREVFTMLEQHAAIFEGRSTQPLANVLMNDAVALPVVIENLSAQKEAALQDLVAYWNMYVQQMALVIGFVELTIPSYEKLKSERMKVIGQKLVALTNDFADTLAQKVNDSFYNPKQLFYDDLQRLRAQVGQELSNFSLLESFKRHDFLVE